jgi:hypothetical protein
MPCQASIFGTRQPDVRCGSLMAAGRLSVKTRRPCLASEGGKSTMPMMLFWLPTIFIGAFFELARIACESSVRNGQLWLGDPLSADASRND